MKLWFFEIGEPLPHEPDVRFHRYGLYSRYLVRNGHDVTIWTSTFSHTPKIHVRDMDCVEEHDGVVYRFYYGDGYRRNVSWARIQHNRTFAKRIEEDLSNIPETDFPDVLVIPIPVIEVAHVVSSFSKEKGIPAIVDIRDEWPDEIVNIAPPLFRPMVRLLFSTSYVRMREICSSATAISGVSQRQVDYGRSFSRSSNFSFPFPLGYERIELSAAAMDKIREDLKRKFDFTQYERVFCFFGTMGRFFRLDNVIRAACQFPQFGFILAGDGQSKSELDELASDLHNVFLPGWIDKNMIAAIMSVSDIGLAPYYGSDAFSLPNKPFEYMSGGLAILSSIQGELKDIISSNEIGTTIEDTSVSTIEAAILEVTKDPARLNRMKKNSYRLFENHYSSEAVFAIATQQISEAIEIAENGPQARDVTT